MLKVHIGAGGTGPRCSWFLLFTLQGFNLELTLLQKNYARVNLLFKLLRLPRDIVTWDFPPGPSPVYIKAGYIRSSNNLHRC